MTNAGHSIPKHPPCRGTRRDGTPCKAAGLLDGWCFAHHPEREEARRASREKGGRSKASAARAEKLVPAILRPVLDTLLAAVGEVKAGTITTQQAGALSSLAGAIVKVYQVGALEERIAALEASQATQETQGTPEGGMSLALNGRLKKLEVLQAAVAARPRVPRWWEGVPELVLAYLAAQPPDVAASFTRHLAWMQDLPGNKDGFRYYQVLTRPWRPGERRFVVPAMMVYDAIFNLGDGLTTGEAQVRVLVCGYHNLLDATPDAGPTPAHADEREAVYRAKVAGVLATMVGGPLCAYPSCLCFSSTHHCCRNAAAVVAAWRVRGTTDPATLAAMGFGEAELAFPATDDDDVEEARDAA